MRLPHPAVRCQPRVKLGERLGAQAIPAAGSLDADGNETGVAQHAKMLGRQRLCQSEPLGEFTDEMLAVAEAVEDRPAQRLCQDLKGCQQARSMPYQAYAMQRMNGWPTNKFVSSL